MTNRHEERSAKTGQYKTRPPCAWCGKSTPVEFYSDHETCNQGLGQFLCGRARCIAVRDAAPLAERLARYAAPALVSK